MNRLALAVSLCLALPAGCGGADRQAASTLAAAGGIPTALVADATDLYWLARDRTGQHGRVFRLAKAGGVPVALAEELAFPSALAVGAGSVYVVAAGRLLKLPGGAGARPEPLADGVRAIAVGAGYVYWT